MNSFRNNIKRKGKRALAFFLTLNMLSGTFIGTVSFAASPEDEAEPAAVEVRHDPAPTPAASASAAPAASPAASASPAAVVPSSVPSPSPSAGAV